LRDFYEICSVCRDALAVKIWTDFLEGLRSYGSVKLRVSSFHQIVSAPI